MKLVRNINFHFIQFIFYGRQYDMGSLRPIQVIMFALYIHTYSINAYQIPRLIVPQSLKTFHTYKDHFRWQPSYTSKLQSSICGRCMSSALQSSSQDISYDNNNRRRRIGIIGGGASGMFAATAAADKISSKECDVVVLESTSKTMSKVRISGGGRCNVMHDTTKALPQILSSYPRGNKELRGLYTKRFTPDDAYDWFTSRGVQLKTEADGRMFPITDNSQTIIDTISQAAVKAGVEIRMKEKVDSVETNDEGQYVVNISSKSSSNTSDRVKSEEVFDSLILATGSFPLGHEIARSLGHDIVKPVPSLFTLDSKELTGNEGIFNGLAGVSVPLAQLTLVVNDEMLGIEQSTDESNESEASDNTPATKKKKKRKKKAPTIVQEGPLLITHSGVSGPAALRLSAFAAREFNKVSYKCEVKIHFCPTYEEELRDMNKSGSSESILMDALWDMTRLIPKRRVATGCPLFLKDSKEEESQKSLPVIPKRLWQALVTEASGIPSTTTWADVSKKMIRSLANNLSAFPLKVTSKSTFKEEFVTAGGVNLKEITMSKMESKITPGLFMCGEVLNVDGVTGGYNFMGCWSTGFVAGESAANFCCHDLKKRVDTDRVINM